MARQSSPDSVSSRIAKIEVNETISFPNPYTSIAVMVSLLKKKNEHTNKIFRIKSVKDITSVTRVI